MHIQYYSGDTGWGKMPSDQELYNLIDDLQHPDPLTSMMAAQRLGEIADLRVLDPLLDALMVTRGQDRWNVVMALAHLGDIAVDPLIDVLLTSTDESLIRGVARVLGAIGDDRAAGPLFQVYQASSGKTQHVIDAALRELGYDPTLDPTD